MRRSLCLVSLTLVGIVLVVARDEARQPRQTIVAQQVTDNLYMLGSDPSGEGMRTGGNTALFETATGVVLVDTKLAGYGPDILAEVRKITSKPVTTIINTHTHFDHSGANTEFPDTVDYVAHENIKFHMARDDCQPVTNCDAFKGDNAKYLPATTFSDRMSLFSGPDQIDLYHFGRGHTDGDTFVVFKAARAMHTGDMFLGKFLPFIDAENGNGGECCRVRPHADEGHRGYPGRRHDHHRPLGDAAGVERPRGLPCVLHRSGRQSARGHRGRP